MSMTENITDPTDPHPGDTIVQVAVGDIAPHPKNRTAENLDDLAKSIAAVGVIEPIIIRPHDNGDGARYELVAGERRWRAACTAGLEHVPSIVRDLTAIEADEMRLIENLQREDLTPLDEALQYRDLLAHEGWDQRRLADRVGVNQSHVSRRLSLLKLPEKAQRALDAGGITVHDAQELTKLAGHPKILEELLNQRPHDIEWAVGRALQGIESEQKKAKRIAELEKKGITTLELSGYGPPKGAKEIGGYGGYLNVDVKKHAKEPCHAVAVSPSTYGADRAFCTDPKRHSATGASDLKATRAPSSSGPGKSDAVKRREAAERDATKARRAALAGVLGRKPPKDFVQSIYRRYIADAAHDERQKMCQLLGLDPPAQKGYDRPDYHAAIDTYAARSDAHLQQTAFAFFLVQGEWGYSHADENRRLLLDAGYEPHPSERADFKKAVAK